ncbi:MULTISPECIES: 1-phosphofructokinase family hexose kinase [Flavobacteriaceae]|uniref:1-phosphofructokinase family hexose kinase n=1 Tax=Flavobacteriaceae TaxID=49546 RepID=UPI00234B4CB1|nr:PfkB family carbohydrate kinase [Muricauda sp. SP22]MDC6363609.1 PfkB family carbohydrate kinase [Muricauda sp. SP22]
MILCICPNPSIDSYAYFKEFEIGSVNRMEKIKAYPGGKATHVALALAEMGKKVTLFGFWGGTTGQWIKMECEKRGIQIEGVELSENNRQCYTFRSDDSSIANTEILEPGPTISPKDWESFTLKLQELVGLSEMVNLSGSWPKGVPENASQAVAQTCKELNKKLLLDGTGGQLKNALKMGFYGLHVNEHEAKDLFGTEEAEKVQEGLKGSVQLLALTKGKKGLYLADGKEVVHALKPLEKVISTVGSGDCLTAGILYALSENMSLEQVARYGAAFGAANCVNDDLGMLKHKDVMDFLPSTETKLLCHG